MHGKRNQTEQEIYSAWQQGDFEQATTAALRAYGPEILGFLSAKLRRREDADEVFSQFSLDFWCGLAGFEWRCTARVWAYTLARHAANRFLKSPHRQPRRNIPLSQVSSISKLAGQIRSSTASYRRTAVKDKMNSLRQRLPAADQELLILRVDKQMSWRQLALVLSYQGQTVADEQLTRETARLRKRFQLVKQKLHKLAQAEGLLGDRSRRCDG